MNKQIKILSRDIVQPIRGHEILSADSEYIIGSSPFTEQERNDLGHKTTHLLHLLCDLPNRFFKGDYQLFLERLQFNRAQIMSILKMLDSLTPDVFARSDFVRTREGFKLHEVNVGANLLSLISVASSPSLSGIKQKLNAMEIWATELAKLIGDSAVVVFLHPSKELKTMEIAENNLFNYIKFLKQASEAQIRIKTENQLKLQDDRLWTDEGEPVDFIYPIFNEHNIEDNPKGYEPVVTAIKENLVNCPIGPHYAVISNKAVLALLWELHDEGYLSELEASLVASFVPRTEFLTSENFELIVKQKNDYVIKPINLLGSQGVLSGRDHDLKEWKACVKRALESSIFYVAQIIAAPHIENVLVTEGSETVERECQMSYGIYVFREKIMGGMVRARPSSNSLVFALDDDKKYYGPMLFEDE